MNPPLQNTSLSNAAKGWGRFDTLGGRTLYVARPQRCAFQEVLAPLGRRLGRTDSLTADAQFLDLSAAALAQIVTDEWSDRGFMRPGNLSAGWRFERLLYEFTNPASGWWIDIEHVDSLTAISRALTDELAARGIAAVDRSVLLGPERAITVLIATWARQLVLDDDTQPLGITWRSKHGAGSCWAYWMRHVDDIRDPTSEPLISIQPGRPITRGDNALRAAASSLGITIW